MSIYSHSINSTVDQSKPIKESVAVLYLLCIIYYLVYNRCLYFVLHAHPPACKAERTCARTLRSLPFRRIYQCTLSCWWIWNFEYPLIDSACKYAGKQQGLPRQRSCLDAPKVQCEQKGESWRLGCIDVFVGCRRVIGLEMNV